ncbi:MAG TPA: transposase, partial [Myxococcaceae bacterium]|nr:transposase [Myxococcaceae bacterium]
RGPLSLERLSALPDGRLAYRMKRPSPTGQTHLVMAPVAFLRRLAALVPPPRANLVRYFGVFAPNTRVRHRVVPVPPPALLPKAPLCPVAPEPVRPLPRPHRPIPWADLLKRTFQTDVLTSPRCGGKRRVVAVVLRSTTAQAILEHLRLPSRSLPLAPATSPPQLGFW